MQGNAWVATMVTSKENYIYRTGHMQCTNTCRVNHVAIYGFER